MERKTTVERNKKDGQNHRTQKDGKGIRKMERNTTERNEMERTKLDRNKMEKKT